MADAASAEGRAVRDLVMIGASAGGVETLKPATEVTLRKVGDSETRQTAGNAGQA